MILLISIGVDYLSLKSIVSSLGSELKGSLISYRMFRWREDIHLLSIVNHSLVLHIAKISNHLQIVAIIHELSVGNYDVVELDLGCCNYMNDLRSYENG